MSIDTLSRIFLILGLVFLVIGGVLFLVSRLGIPLGNLPGDIRIERGNFTCLVALGTSLVLSILLSLALNLIIRFLNR